MKKFLVLHTLFFGSLGFEIGWIVCLCMGHTLAEAWDIVAAIAGLAGIFPGLFGGILYLYGKDTKGY